MCGIVTIMAPVGKGVDSDILEAMTRVLAHRGPDDFGYACVDPRSGASESWTRAAGARELAGVAFGHRRLSILDLTPGGHQPMFSDDGSMILAYNGEIYNYVELRRELEQLGVAFRTRCDTEVLLKAYECWGDAAFSRFNGMWAFTLWDGRRQKLIACRDRFGVKPLYYTIVDGTWVFASEIKSVLTFPGAFRGVRDRSIQRFVLHNMVDGDDSTMFRDIWALSPGTFLEIGAEGASHRRFWALAIDGRYDGQSRQQLVDRYGELLSDAVRLRVRSDVPIGTMLSGGLDSTSITALICEQRAAWSASDSNHAPIALSNSNITSFTACWPGWSGDEEAKVDAFCANLGLLSHKVYLTSNGLFDVLSKVVYHLDEPFENPTSLVQYLLMNEARNYGIKVVLNGHGSDEALAGYSRFVPPFLAQVLLSGHPVAFLRNYRAFRRNIPLARSSILDQILLGLRRHFRRTSKPASAPLADPARNAGRFAPYCQRADALRGTRRLSLLGDALWVAFSTRTLPSWLRMEDRMSMACSIESRVPFLDYRLIELSFNLPDDLKARNGFTKAVLREAMRSRLPASIAMDPRKTRFSSPYGLWLRNEWRPLLEDNLAGACRLDGHMDTDDLKRGLKLFAAGAPEAPGADTIWRALSAELFLATFSGAGGIAG